MLCWNCGSDLIWRADHSFEDQNIPGEGIVSNFSCSTCPATVLFYLPSEAKE